MFHLSDKFDRWVEKFLGGDLDQRAKILSWLALLFLAVSFIALFYFLQFPVTTHDPESGDAIEMPAKDLLFKRSEAD